MPGNVCSMAGARFLTIAEQVAVHLRGELSRGRWSGLLPGRQRLSDDLEVNIKTVETALRQLEREGMLEGQGAGRKRRILAPADKGARPLRIALLDYEPLALTEGYKIELQHLLMEAGHTAFFTGKCLLQLGMKVPRVRQLVAMTEADAWVVTSASREVLEWFATQPVPVFALFGRRGGLPLAATGPDKPSAMAAATRRLIELGHRRIVLLARRPRRMPEPGTSERVFLKELMAHGISPSAYNLPDWDESIEGFHGRLESLFTLTPPTALIIDEVPFFIAAQQFLGGLRIRVPADVSLICTDDDRGFAWCKPSVAHIRWDISPVVRRIVRWAVNVSHGKRDLRQSLTPAKFVPGGTIGPVRGGISDQ